MLASLQDKVAAQAAIIAAMGGTSARPVPAVSEALRVSAVCKRWLELTASDRAPKEAVKHTQRVAAFIAKHGDMAIDAPDFRDAVDSYLQGLLAAGYERSTVRIIAGTFGAITGWACERRLIAFDPMTGVKKHFKDYRSASAKRDPFTPEQVAQIVAAMPAAWGADSDRTALVSLIVATGCRAGEAAQARVCDVREIAPDVFTLTIGGAFKQEAQPDNGCPRHVKTPESRRTIPLHPSIVPLIRGALARRMVDGSPRLFGAEGTPADTQDSGATVKRLTAAFTRLIEKRCGIEDPRNVLSLHSLRHTMIDLFDRSNVQPRLRATFVGHSTIAYGGPSTLAEMLAIVPGLPVLGAP
jgi:integrase